jgi:hypothetical protein
LSNEYEPTQLGLFIAAAITITIIFFVVGAYLKTQRDLDAVERAVGGGKPR